jgi:hypothetical protein
VVTYISAFLVLNGQFIMFSTDIFLCFEQSIKSWPLNSARGTPLFLANWLSCRAAKSVLLSTGALFASNDSKTSFQQRKNAR